MQITLYLFFISLNNILTEKIISFKFNYISGSYYSSIGIGEPSQSKLFGFNMGYDYTWSGTIPTFQISISKTRYIEENKKRTLNLYCDYRETEGTPIVDRLNIETRGGITVIIDNYTIYGVSNNDIGISDSIGLSRTILNKENSFVTAFKKKGLIDNLGFGFSAIDFNEGDLYLGGINNYKFLQYPAKFSCNIKENIPYWGCGMTKMRIGNNKIMDSNYYAMFQVNQSFIIAPDIILSQLNETIFKPFIKDKTCHYYEYPGAKNFICKCDTIEKIPDITFFFNNQGVKFKAKHLFEQYGINCKFNIVGAEWNSPFFVLGSYFIQRFLSYFDFETKTVSLYSSEEFETLNSSSIYFNYKSIVILYIITDFMMCIGLFHLIYKTIKK